MFNLRTQQAKWISYEMFSANAAVLAEENGRPPKISEGRTFLSHPWLSWRALQQLQVLYSCALTEMILCFSAVATPLVSAFGKAIAAQPGVFATSRSLTSLSLTV